jgi:hypothetical protein
VSSENTFHWSPDPELGQRNIVTKSPIVSGTKLNRDLSELQTSIESNIFVTICAMIVHGSVDKYLVRLFYAIALSVRQFSFLS